MSEVAHNAEREFWRPPPAQASADAPVLVQACTRCGSEFMVGSRFCHVCGTARQLQGDAVSIPGWTRHLEFHNIQRWFGLRTASLVAFFTGLACALMAIATGFVYSIHTVLEWQAVQVYRMQWLLAAVAAFVASLLLKRAETS